MYDSDKRKLLCLLCHGSVFFGSLLVFIGVPFAILFVSDDPIVKGSAKETLNFHFNIWIYEFIIGVLWFTILGIPVAIVLMIPFFLLHWILPIFAILKVLKNPDEGYRYPFIFRIF